MLLLLPKKLRSIVTVTALDYALHALVAVRENAKDAKVVVKMDANLHVEVVVVKAVKDVVTHYVRIIVLLDVKLPATAYVEDLA